MQKNGERASCTSKELSVQADGKSLIWQRKAPQPPHIPYPKAEGGEKLGDPARKILVVSTVVETVHGNWNCASILLFPFHFEKKNPMNTSESIIATSRFFFQRRIDEKEENVSIQRVINWNLTPKSKNFAPNR